MKTNVFIVVGIVLMVLWLLLLWQLKWVILGGVLFVTTLEMIHEYREGINLE